MNLSKFFRALRVNIQYFAMLWRDDFQYLLEHVDTKVKI